MTGCHRLVMTAVACALVAAGTACAPTGESEPNRPGAGAADAGGWEVRPVPMPALSRLEASVQDQVRERYATLSARTAASDTPSGDLAGAHGDVGLILMATGLHAGAETSLRNAQALAPRDPRWPYYLGQLKLVSGDRANAPGFFEQALDLRPTDLPTVVRLGEAYLEVSRQEDAERMFRQAREIEPRSAAALAGLGQAALARGDQTQAVDYLEQALALEPEATRLHYPLAQAYRSLGEQDKANAHLARRGDGEPGLYDPLMQEYYWLIESAEAHHQRGALAMEAGEYASAASLFRRGLELDPDSPTLGHSLGLAMYWLGEVDRAAEQFETVLGRSPDDTDTHFSLAVLLAERRRFGDALVHFAAAAEHDPGRVGAHIGQAEMLRNMGQLAASLQHWRRAVELDATNATSWIEGATALVRLERYADARSWVADAREFHAGHPELRRIDDTAEAVLALRRELKP